ncbi:phytase, partial [Streptomyces sp. XY511]
MTGARIQRIAGDYGNNVDLRGNIVVSADDEAADGNGAMHVYRIDPATRQLKRLRDIPTEVTAHGICLYTSPASGKLYAFPNSTSGRVEQWEIAVDGDAVTATSVRLWDAGSAVEGCYADETTGKLYLGEEDVGVWVYGAEPTSGTGRTRLDSTGSGGHITADTEGITAAGNRIYVSSQG